MASNPPARCCTVGVKHEGKSTGQIITQSDIPTYLAKPEKTSTDAILILPDVIGHEAINVQLIADQFAANGYLTIVPDLFQGDPIPLNRPGDFDFPAWIKKHGTDKVDPIVEKSISWLRSEHGIKKIGGVGYCFGAKYVCRFLASGKGLDVGYVAHPSFVEEDELRNIKGPLSIAAAEIDQIFPPEKRHKSEEILKEIKAQYQLTLYSGVEHGFSVRGDIKVAGIKFAKEAAFLQAVQWFDEFLKEGKRDSAAHQKL